MLEWLAPSFIYALVKDAWRALRGRRRNLSAAQILELRQKWRPLFEKEIWTNYKEKLREDVIVRDVRRLDKYPLADAKPRRISPWFRVGLIDTYHKGILLWLRTGTLVADNEKWRFTNYDVGEIGDIKVVLAGRVPFELIEAVDWQGDEYYAFPHIYCYFDARKKQPYEELVLCEERKRLDMPSYYHEIAKYDEVRRRSEKLGIRYFG